MTFRKRAQQEVKATVTQLQKEAAWSTSALRKIRMELGEEMKKQEEADSINKKLAVIEQNLGS